MLDEMHLRGVALEPDRIAKWDAAQARLFGAAPLAPLLEHPEFPASTYGRALARHGDEAAARRAEAQERLRHAEQRPPEVYVAEPSCPFECCQLGRWVARKRVELYDAPVDGQRIGELAPGAAVTALQGRSYVEPVPVVSVVAWSGSDFEVDPGQLLWILEGEGEGHYSVQLGTRRHEAFFFDSDRICTSPGPGCEYEYLTEPTLLNRRNEWWTRVRLESGAEAWLEPRGRFDGSSGCG